jgi:hypothetical protein
LITKSQNKSVSQISPRTKTFLSKSTILFLVGAITKETYHPNAFLSGIKNVKRGLRSRTRVLNVLENQSADAKTIARESGVSYGVVMHHLKLLRSEGTVEGKGNRPRIWVLTGLGQKRLVG